MIDLSKCSPEHCGCDTPEMCTPENCPDTNNSNTAKNSGCCPSSNTDQQTQKECGSQTSSSAPQCGSPVDSEIPSFGSLERGCPSMARKFGTDERFTVPAMQDVIYPPVPFPTNRIFNTAGEEKIRELVTHHHNLLRVSPVKHLFAHSDSKFAILVERTADFFVEMFGGPQHFTPEHGQPKLRDRHFPFTISEKDRIVWLERMEQALIETNFPIELHEEIWNWVEPLSIRMINRRTNMDAIERLPFNTRERLLKVQ